MNKEIVLTITMLVSDREDTIEKCMKSISHLMNVVPSELIIVDTAGNEKCMEIVRQYTDKIVRFKWCDDFAAARNAGLRLAQGNWVMFLDDDEWFENTKELEDFFVSGLYKKYKSAAYFVRNYLNKEGSVWRDSLALRLAKREKITKFIGKIHESLTPLEQPIYHSRDYAHHYGYVFTTEQERIEHSWRNIQPLLARRKEKPDDYHAAAQLVQEYMSTQDYFAAIELIRELKKKPQAWTIKSIGFTSFMIVKEIEIYRIQQRFQDAYKTGKELLDNNKNLLFVKGSLLNQLIGICYRLEKYSETLEYIEQFRKVMDEWEQNDGYEKQDLFRVSQQYMVKGERSRFSFMELHIFVLEKEWENAKQILINTDWTDKEMRMLVDTSKDIVETLSNVSYQEELIIPLKIISENPAQQEMVYKFVNELEDDKKRKLLAYFYKLSPITSEIYKYHIIYANYISDKDKIENSLQKMDQERKSIYLEDIEYWNILYQNDISLVPYIDKSRSYDWIQIVENLLKKFDLKESEKVYLVLTKGLDKKDIRFLYLTALWMEKRVLEMSFEENSDEWQQLYSVALHWISCAMFLYKEDVLTSDLIEAIPSQYQFAWYILQANSFKENNRYLFVQKISDAAKAYPVMKELCKIVMMKYADIKD